MQVQGEGNSSGEKNFLNLARLGRTSALHFVVSFVWILFMWQIVGSFPYAILFLAFPSASPSLMTVALLFSFLVLLFALWSAVVVIHQRKFTTLITPQLPVSVLRLGQGFGVWFLLTLVTSVVDYAIRPDFYSFTFDPLPWLVFALIGGLLVLLQASTEELLFRGYLLQWLGLLSRNKVLIVLVNGLLFALPHLLNPEMAAGFFLIFSYYFLFGCFLAWITIRDNRLELAAGAHVANNLFAALAINYKGSALATPAILTAEGIDPVTNMLWFLLSAALFYVWFFVVSKKPSTAGEAL